MTLIYDITWKLIESPTKRSALTIYHDQLVLVGGKEVPTNKTTDKLWTLQEDEQTFTQTLPLMFTARLGASAISTDNHLVVAGGVGSNFTNLDVVEVYNSQQWMSGCLMRS